MTQLETESGEHRMQQIEHNFKRFYDEIVRALVDIHNNTERVMDLVNFFVDNTPKPKVNKRFINDMSQKLISIEGLEKYLYKDLASIVETYLVGDPFICQPWFDGFFYVIQAWDMKMEWTQTQTFTHYVFYPTEKSISFGITWERKSVTFEYTSYKELQGLRIIYMYDTMETRISWTHIIGEQQFHFVKNGLVKVKMSKHGLAKLS